MQLRHNRPVSGQYVDGYSSEGSTAKGDSPPSDTVPQCTPPPVIQHNPNFPAASFPSLPTHEAAQREHLRRAVGINSTESKQKQIQRAYQHGRNHAANNLKAHSQVGTVGDKPTTTTHDDGLSDNDGDGDFDPSDLSSPEGSDNDDDCKSKKKPAYPKKSLLGPSRTNPSSAQVTGVISRQPPITTTFAPGLRRPQGNRGRPRVIKPNSPFQEKPEWKGHWWSATDEIIFQREMETDDDEGRKHGGMEITWDDLEEPLRLEIVEGLFRRGYSSPRIIEYLGLNQAQVDEHSRVTKEQSARITFENREINLILGQIYRKFRKLRETNDRAIDVKFSTSDGVKKWVIEYLELAPPMNGMVDLTMNQVLPQSGYGKIIDRKLNEIRALWNGPRKAISRGDIKDARSWLRKKKLDVSLAGGWRSTTELPDLPPRSASENESEDGSGDEDSEAPAPATEGPSKAAKGTPARAASPKKPTPQVNGNTVLDKDTTNKSTTTSVSRPQNTIPGQRVGGPLPHAVHNIARSSSSVRVNAPNGIPCAAAQTIPSSVPRNASTEEPQKAPGGGQQSPIYKPQPVAKTSSKLNVRQPNISSNKATGKAQQDLQRSRVATPNANKPYDSQRQHDQLREQERMVERAKEAIANNPAYRAFHQQQARACLPRGSGTPVPPTMGAPPAIPRMSSTPIPKMPGAPVANMAQMSNMMPPKAPNNGRPVSAAANMAPAIGAQAQQQTGNPKKRAAPADNDVAGTQTVTPGWTPQISKRQCLPGSSAANVMDVEHVFQGDAPFLTHVFAANVVSGIGTGDTLANLDSLPSPTSPTLPNGISSTGFMETLSNTAYGNTAYGNAAYGNAAYGNAGFGNIGFGNTGFVDNGFGNAGLNNNEFSNTSFNNIDIIDNAAMPPPALPTSIFSPGISAQFPNNDAENNDVVNNNATCNNNNNAMGSNNTMGNNVDGTVDNVMFDEFCASTDFDTTAFPNPTGLDPPLSHGTNMPNLPNALCEIEVTAEEIANFEEMYGPNAFATSILDQSEVRPLAQPEIQPAPQPMAQPTTSGHVPSDYLDQTVAFALTQFLGKSRAEENLVNDASLMNKVGLGSVDFMTGMGNAGVPAMDLNGMMPQGVLGQSNGLSALNSGFGVPQSGFGGQAGQMAMPATTRAGFANGGNDGSGGNVDWQMKRGRPSKGDLKKIQTNARS